MKLEEVGEFRSGIHFGGLSLFEMLGEGHPLERALSPRGAIFSLIGYKVNNYFFVSLYLYSTKI